MEAYDDGDGEIEFAEFQEMVTEMRSFKEAGIKNSLEEAHFLESTSGDIYMFRVVAMVEKYVPYKNIGMRRKQMKQAKGRVEDHRQHNLDQGKVRRSHANKCGCLP